MKTPQRSISSLLLPWSLMGAAALLGACSSTPVAETKAADKAVVTTQKTDGAGTVKGGGKTDGAPSAKITTKTLPPYLDPKSEISMARSLYFDYDAALLKPEFTTLIERHGKFLVANPTVPLRIEGNTDERGSAEYNLALGQKRAEAVRRALEVYGVKPTQITVTSWGREKPRATGHDEAAWAQNRRADLQYPNQ